MALEPSPKQKNKKMFSTLLHPPFTAPTQSTSTFSSPLFPSNWTPSATSLFGRFAERSPFTGYEANAPIEVSSEATLVLVLSSIFLSTFDDLATALDASEAGERSDLGRLASPLFFFRSGRQVLTGIYHANRQKF